jgi:Ca-activated chloride channel family protein
MGRNLVGALALLAGLAPAMVRGQGFLVIESTEVVRLPRPIIIYPPWPRPHPTPHFEPPPMSYKISELEVGARLSDQVAQVQVSQSFVNTGSRPMEVSFVFPLPYEGAVESMTLLIDGQEHPAKLLKADEARRMYEEIVRRNRDPALLEWMGTGLFKTSVFPVPAGAKRTVTLRYAQLCRKTEGLTDFLFPLSTAKYTSQAVEKISFRVTIESTQDIKNVYSPTHTIEIKRPDERHATITYSTKNDVPTSDFRLLYDVGKGKLSTRVVSYRPKADDDGYFLLLASPQIKAPDEKRPHKTVVFVIDRSGSMSGKKIEQVRAAAKFILDNLREGDLFNVIAFDNQVEAFRPELQRYNEETRKAARGFVEGVYAGGSTDIDAALRMALAQLQDPNQPNYVIFLTDGLPTAGETNEMKIVEKSKEANKVGARIFSFGVGYDVNGRLLDRLVRDSFGQSQYVRPDEDIEERVSRLYAQIEAPVMTKVQLDIALDARNDDGVKLINRVYPKGTFDLFAGDQLVVVGRYKKPGTAKVSVCGKVGTHEQKFDFPAELTAKSGDESCGFVEKLWAVRRVGEIIDEIDLHGKNQELIQELVELATQHGILTPYTSFLADENVRLHDTANVRRANDQLFALEQTSGESGFAQRALKSGYQNAQNAADASSSYGYSAPAAAPQMRGMGGFDIHGASRGSNLGGRGGLAAGAQPALRNAAALPAEPTAAQETIRQVGNRAFYLRNNQWVDSTLTEKQQAQPKRIKQFSDDYFSLARRNGRQLSQYMVFDEPVLLNVEGQAYLIEP